MTSVLIYQDPPVLTVFLFLAVPPQPKDEMTLYGFVLGQPGDITVNFTANPRPSAVIWKLDGETELAVEPFTGRSSDPRVEVSELRSTVIESSSHQPKKKKEMFQNSIFL